MSTYIEGGAGIGLLYWGLAKESGWKKWALAAAGAYFLYSAYQNSQGGSDT